MKFGLLVILSLLLGALAAIFLMDNNGYVLINFVGYTIEMSVPALLFVMLAAYLLVRLVVRIWQAPSQLGEAAARGRVKRANKRITRGYIELAEGNFAKGEINKKNLCALCASVVSVFEVGNKKGHAPVYPGRGLFM